MKKQLLLLALGSLLACVPAASAMTYTYSTSGCFTDATMVSGNGQNYAYYCSSSGTEDVFVNGADTASALVFTDQGSNSVSGGVIPLGTFGITNYYTNGPESSFAADFTLDVTFTTPAGTSVEAFSGTLAGEMTGYNSTDSITFSSATETFDSPSGDFTLTLTADPLTLNNGSGTVTLDATLAPVTASVAPEPESLMLLGTGMLGLVGAVRKRLA